MEINKHQLIDLKKHSNCELQLRETFPGDLGLYCLDHEMFIMNFEEVVNSG